MRQKISNSVLFIIFILGVCGCAPQHPPTYADMNIRFSNVRVNGKCDDVRSLEIWVTQIYSYYDAIQKIRDKFDAFATDKTSLNDMAGYLSTTQTDFNKLMPPDCAAQAYNYAYYALYLASDFVSNIATRTDKDAEFIVYLLDLFLSEQQKIETQYEAMFDK